MAPCGIAAFLPLAKPGAVCRGMQRALRRHPVIHSLALPGSGIMCRVLSICACFRMRGKLCVRACLEAHPQRYAVGGPLPVLTLPLESVPHSGVTNWLAWPESLRVFRFSESGRLPYASHGGGFAARVR